MPIIKPAATCPVYLRHVASLPPQSNFHCTPFFMPHSFFLRWSKSSLQFLALVFGNGAWLWETDPHNVHKDALFIQILSRVQLPCPKALWELLALGLKRERLLSLGKRGDPQVRKEAPERRTCNPRFECIMLPYGISLVTGMEIVYLDSSGQV